MGRTRATALVVAMALVAGCSAGGDEPASGPDPTPDASPGATTDTVPTSEPTDPTEPAGPHVVAPLDRDLLADAAPLPPGSADDAAAALAATVVGSADPAERQAALVTALARSGVEIYDLDGTTIVAPAEPATGLSLSAGEVLALAELPTDVVIPLDEFATDLTPFLGLTEDHAPDVAAALASDMGASAERDEPTARFFGRFLNGLGVAADDVGFHVSTADAGTARLSSLQTILVMYRVAADLADPAGLAHDGAAPQGLARPRAGEVDCALATSDQQAAGSRFANSAGAAFGTVIDMVNSAAGAAGTAVSVLLQAVKLILAQTNFKVDYQLDPQPLVRTTSTRSDGEQVRVSVQVRYVPTGAWAHCVIAAFAVIGVEPGVAKDLNDITVKWRGGEGFATGSSPGWVQFAAGSATGSDVRTKTDKDGKTSIVFEGKHQRENMTVSVPVMRRVSVVAQLDLDESKMHDSVLSAAAAAAGGPFTAILDVLAKGLSNIAGNAHRIPIEMQDRVDDYQVAWSDGNVSMDGRSCSIGESPMAVSLSGTVSSGAGSAAVNGTLVVTLGRDLRGTATGTIDVVAGPATLSSEVSDVDVVLRLDERTGTGTLELTGGTVASNIAGQIVNTTFSESLGSAPGTPVVVAAQAGDLCGE